MVSYTSIIIKLMLIWNYLEELINNINEKTKKMYQYMKDFIYGYNDMWIFTPGHTLPISLNNISNTITSSWIYDNYDNTLTLITNKSSDFNEYKFSWLSAKLVIYKDSNTSPIEYSIDNFIEKMNLITINEIVPSLYIIFMCWCAHNKYWFSLDDTVEFHIIDNMGEDIILNLYTHNDSLCIKRNKIDIIIDIDNDLNNNDLNKSDINDSDKDEENKVFKEK
jgi:hypothetical protein